MPLRVFHALKAHRELSELLRDLPRALRPAVPFDYVSLYLDHDILDRDSVCTAAWYVLDAEDPSMLSPAHDIPVEAEHALSVFERQEPAVIPHLDHDTRFSGPAKSASERKLHSACAVPLTTAHRRLGSLHIAAVNPDAYSDEAVRFLSEVADQIALALDNALSHAEFNREREQLTLLLELTDCVAANRQLPDVLRAVTTSGRRVIRSDCAAVALPDPESGQLRVYAFDGASGDRSLRDQAVHALEGPLGERVFRTGQPWAGPVEKRSTSHWGVDARSVVGEEQTACVLPLVSKSRVLGTLGLWRRVDHPYDVQFLAKVSKPIAMAVESALADGEIRQLRDKLAREKLYPEDHTQSEMNFEEIVGKSAALRRVLVQVETVAPTDSTVLISGETGTGKELIARAIHQLSPRRGHAFVKLNCAAIPTGLLESELFGHEKGAFTGAIAQRIGRFELAHRGTVFLDEVGEIPLELQTKLLRVLQEREFERLGSARTLRTDARLIAATNRDLTVMVEEGTFRADLFYRLHVFPLHVPALRERAEDIPLLVRHFAQHFARCMNRTIETIPSDAMEALTRYLWPGNIRELENLIERAVILSSGPVLRVPLGDLQSRLTPGPVNGKHGTLAEAERAHILAILKETRWVLSGPRGAATRLGMNRSTLQFRMKKLGIARPGM